MNINFQTANPTFADGSLAKDLLRAIGCVLAAMLLGSAIWAGMNYFLEKIPTRLMILVASGIGVGIAYALFLPFRQVKWIVVLGLLPIALLATGMSLLIGDIFAIAIAASKVPEYELTFPQALLAAVLAIGEWLPERDIWLPLALGLLGAFLSYLGVARKQLRRGKPIVVASKNAPLPGAGNLPSRFAEVTHLGAPQHVFQPGSVKRVAGLIGYAIFMVLALAMLGLMLFLYVGNPARNDVAALIALVVFMGIAFIVLGYYFVKALRHWHECGVVYENGFAYFSGKQLFAWAWPEIAEIKADLKEVLMYGLIKVGTRQKYTLVSTNGTTFKLQDNLKDVAQFIQLLQQRSAQALRGRYIQQLERGDTVPFGKLSLNRDGIQIKEGNLLTWGEIANISLNEGTLVIKRNSNAVFPNISISASQIANLDLFMSLLFDESKK